MSTHSMASTGDRHPRERGEISRERIREVLRERRRAGLKPPTLDELAESTGLAKTTVHHHLKWMEDQHILQIEDARREITLLEEAAPPEQEAGS